MIDEKETRILKEVIVRYVTDGRIVKAYDQEEITRCKDCRHFEYDHVEHVDGVPLIMAHEICTRWGEGCKTSENGYCFMAERRREE